MDIPRKLSPPIKAAGGRLVNRRGAASGGGKRPKRRQTRPFPLRPVPLWCARPPAWWNGRHMGLKLPGPKGRAGSSPAAGTSFRVLRPGTFFGPAALGVQAEGGPHGPASQTANRSGSAAARSRSAAHRQPRLGHGAQSGAGLPGQGGPSGRCAGAVAAGALNWVGPVRPLWRRPSPSPCDEGSPCPAGCPKHPASARPAHGGRLHARRVGRWPPPVFD